MAKVDLKKELKHLYQSSTKEVVRVEVPAMKYLMVDGEGDPNTSQAFKAAVEVLFPLSYTLKFMVKKGPSAIDYGVMPLEGLWWADDMSKFTVEDKSNWHWTLMIMQSDFVTGKMVDAAIAEVEKKRVLPHFRKFASRLCWKGFARRSCTLAHFRKKGLLSKNCISSLRDADANEPKNITKST